MRILFWLCFFLIAYAYVGYIFWLWVELRLRKSVFVRKEMFPSVSIVMAARNEEKNLLAKVENLHGMNYPTDKLEIIVVSRFNRRYRRDFAARGRQGGSGHPQE